MAEINNSIEDLNNPGTPDFSPEVIESQLRSINGYIDKNLPLILEGMNNAEVSYEKRFQDLNSIMPKSKAPDIRDIQTNIAGDSLIRPGLDLKRVDDDGTQSYVDSLASKLSTDIATKPDPYKYARPTSFNASRFGSNYERYYASDDAFKKLGFNVYRDNESLYNANNTWFDDFSRMGSKYMSLFGGAFTGMFKNWGKFGAAGAAEEAAKMENDLSIATSTKEGFGAWTTNFLANSAYTIGTISELVIENFLIASAASATRNPALIAVAGGRNAMKLGQMQRALSTMVKTMRDPSKARSFWTAAKGLGHNVLPMSEFRSFADDVLNPNSAFHRVSNMAKAGRGFGSFYRGMAEINAVTAESRLEGGFVQNKVAQDSYNAFIKKNGRNPTAEEAEEIYDNALQAGSRTTMLNVPAIYFSNKVVLDTAFRSFKPLSRLLDKQAMKSPFYKVIENVNWKKAGKDPYEVIKKGSIFEQGKKIFSADALKNIPSRLVDTSRQGFKKTAGNTIRYFNANLMEGMQELYQEGLQEGVGSYYLENYYANLYQDPLRAANNTVLRAMSDGVMSQLNSQGLDVFLSGFLMGGVLQPVQSGFASLSLSSMRIGDYINKTDEYTKYQEQEKERVDRYVQTLNDVTKNPQAYAKWIDENLKLQRDMMAEYDRSEQTGDRKEGEDAKQDSLFSHVYTLAATGKLSILQDQLADLKNLTPEELAEAFGETHEDTADFNSNMKMRLDNVIKKVDQVKKRYERASSIKNPFNPDYFNEEKDPVNYNKEKIGYDAFEKAKMMFAFNEYTLDRSLDRIESLIREASTEGPLGKVAASDFSILYSNRTTKQQFIAALASEIQAYQDGTKEGEAKVKTLKAQLEDLLEIDNATSNYRAIHKLIEKAKTSPKAAEELKKIAQDIKPNVELVDEATGQMIMDFEKGDIAPDVVVNEYYKELVKDSYDKYTKTIAENNSVYTGQFDTNESFNKLIDFLRLDADAQNSSDIINTLADPLALLRMAQKIQVANEKVNERMEELHRKAVEDFTNKIQADEFLQQLLEMGVYFKPEYVESYFEKDELPKEFLDVTDNTTIKEGDEKYQQIIDLITKIEQLRGKTFSGKPAPVRPKPAPAPAATPVTPAPAGTSTAPTPAATAGTSSQDLPEQDDEDPLSIYSESVANRLRAEFEKKFPDPATRPGNIMDWILESPIAAKIINGVGDGKLNVDLSTITDLITPDNPKSIVTAIGAVADLYKNQFALTPGKDGYVGVINDTRVTAKRVSSLLPKDIKADTRFSRKRGDFIDLVLRSFSTPGTEGLSPKDYLLNAIQVYNKTGDATNLDVARVAIEEMVSSIANQFSNDTEFPINFTEGSISDFANVLEELAILLKDYTWYPAIPAMGGMIRNDLYAGQIDLLLEKDGKFYLVDFKTSMSPRRGLKEYYETSDLVQQNAYAELMRQNSMIDVDGIFILNFITNENKDKKVLNKIQLDYRVKTDGKESVFYEVPKKPIEEILNEMLGPVPVTAVPTPAPTPVSDLEGTKPAETPVVTEEVIETQPTKAEQIRDLEESIMDKYRQIEDLELRAELADDPYSNPNIYIANNLPKITPESAKKETGTKTGTKKDINPSLLSKKGVSVERAAERIVSLAESENIYLEEGYVRDQIIEILQLGLNEYRIKSGMAQVGKVGQLKREIKELEAKLAALQSAPEPEAPSDKASAPTRFKGKLIYAEPGSVDPSVFRQYDVVNADDILATIGTEMGITPEAGESIYKAIYNSPRSEEVYSEFKKRVNSLTKSGKTVITSSFTLRDLADVRSTPARGEFKFFAGATSEEESLKMFDAWVNQNSTRKSQYDAAQEEGWESVVQPIKKGQPAFEATTNKTVKELFEISQLPSTFVYKMQTASSLTTLRNLAAIYFSDPTNKKKFYNVTPEGKRILLEPAQVKALYNKRVDQLFKNTRELNAEDITSAKEFFTNLMTEAQIVEQPTTMTEEDKQSAEAAVNESSPTDLAAVAKQAVEDAKKSTVEEVNDEFNNNLDCE